MNASSLPQDNDSEVSSFNESQSEGDTDSTSTSSTTANGSSSTKASPSKPVNTPKIGQPLANLLKTALKSTDKVKLLTENQLKENISKTGFGKCLSELFRRDPKAAAEAAISYNIAKLNQLSSTHGQRITSQDFVNIIKQKLNFKELDGSDPLLQTHQTVNAQKRANPDNQTNDFISPKRVAKASKNNFENINFQKLRNYYHGLDNEMECDLSAPELPVKTSADGINSKSTLSDPRKITKSSNKVKSPPIKCAQLDATKFNSVMKDNFPHLDYNIKISTKGNATIQASNYDDHHTIFDFTKKIGIPAYTFTHKQDKMASWVIKGLHHATDLEDLKDELQNLCPHITINAVRHFNPANRKFQNMKYNMFLVQLPPGQDASGLFEIAFIFHQKIKWEPLRSSDILQCHNCQRLGHVAANCNLMYRCVKCNSPHAHGNCPRPPRSEDSPPSCVNCKGSHPANYKGCEFIKSYKQQLQQIRRDKAQAKEFKLQSYSNYVNNISYAQAVKSNLQVNNKKQNTPLIDDSNTTPAKAQHTKSLPPTTGLFASFNIQFQQLFGCEFLTFLGRLRTFAPGWMNSQDEDHKRLAIIDFLGTFG